MSLRRCAVLLMHWLLALTVHAAAAGPAAAPAAQPDGQSFERRRWTQADGAPGFVSAMAQTADGMMWFGSALGLFSFDGIRFRKVNQVFGQPLQSSNIMYIYKYGDGLAVGYFFGGMSVFTAHGTTHHVAGRGFPQGTVRSISADKAGVLYVATSRGMYMQQGTQWLQVGRDSLPTGDNAWFKADHLGRLWARVNGDFYIRPLGASRFERLAIAAGTATHWSTSGGLYMIPPGQNVQRLDLQPMPATAQLDRPELYRNPPIPGPHGTLWSARRDGLVRLAPGADGVLHVAELFPSSSTHDTQINHQVTDRENNLWIVTPDGIERFRRHRVRHMATPPNAYFWLAQQGYGEELWMGANTAPLARVKADGSRQDTGIKTPNSLLRLGPEHVWLGSADALWEFHGERQQRWDLPPGLDRGAEVQALALERPGRLLVSISRSGLWLFEQGQWRQDRRLQGQPETLPSCMLTDRGGTTWIGMPRNHLVQLTGGVARALPASAGLQVGNILTLAEIDGKLLVGGDLGAAWLERGSAHPIQLRQVENFQRITGIVQDRQGSLWMHSNDGLHRIGAAALARFWQDPAQPLDAELFNFEDGINGVAVPVRPLPSLGLAHDGRLYYATANETGWLDPAAIPRNLRAPTVLLQSLRAAGHEYSARDGLLLPEQTSTIELAFTATALSMPERVRLKFRLDGVDQDWRDAGPERRAQYTNLAPGDYRFHVIAANEDGVWNKDGAQFRFRIEPAFWQTTWFRLAIQLLGLLLAVQAYRWRVAVIRRRAEQHAALRLDATLQERSRIARSLHDNLLQAVQALLLRFHLVEQKLVRQPELQQMVGSALDYAESLVASTRHEVMELRRPQDANELFAALRHAAAQAAPDAGQRLHFSVTGQPRFLRADSCAELSSVLREAVLNSVLHSGARRIAVRLEFADDTLLAEASDDGVGIEAAVARHGKPGHWGIPGMRERIARLGGRLEIAPGAHGGVAVRVSIPAQRAYA